jgi:hypothetical protein
MLGLRRRRRARQWDHELACAVLHSHAVKCWGEGGYGELGNGTAEDSDSPVAVSGVTSAATTSAGGYHTCAVLSGGTVRCWGYNLYGQLGLGHLGYSGTGVTVAGISIYRASSATTLSESASSVAYGHEQTERLSVDVTSSYVGTPGGTVKITTGTATVCTITLSGGKGSCLLSSSQLKVGTHALKATYAGSNVFSSSVSSTVNLKVT